MNFVKKVLMELHEMGYYQVNVERILGLPVNSLTTEARKKETIALMKVIKTYPWLLKVAEANFDKKIAKQEMVYNAGKMISEMAKNIK